MFSIIVHVVTDWTNLAKNQEALTIRANLKDSQDHKNHNVIFNDMEKSYGPNSYDFYYIFTEHIQLSKHCPDN